MTDFKVGDKVRVRSSEPRTDYIGQEFVITELRNTSVDGNGAHFARGDTYGHGVYLEHLELVEAAPVPKSAEVEKLEAEVKEVTTKLGKALLEVSNWERRWSNLEEDLIEEATAGTLSWGGFNDFLDRHDLKRPVRPGTVEVTVQISVDVPVEDINDFYINEATLDEAVRDYENEIRFGNIYEGTITADDER